MTHWEVVQISEVAVIFSGLLVKKSPLSCFTTFFSIMHIVLCSSGEPHTSISKCSTGYLHVFICPIFAPIHPSPALKTTL